MEKQNTGLKKSSELEIEEQMSEEESLEKSEDVYCDQCSKDIEDINLAWFSDKEKDLYFCSKFCFFTWAEQTEVKLGFIDYLKSQNPNLQEIKDKLDELKKEYHQAQTWLDFNYPKGERKEITELDISEQNLEGELDLSDFADLETLDCSYNQLISLKISNCRKLKSVDCGFNNLTNLDSNSLDRLEELNCNDNYLTSFNYSSLNSNKLTCLDISDNNLSKQDLSVFSKFVNLEILVIGSSDEEKIEQDAYNHFTGSLESLKNLTKLKDLHISNTDIDNGLEYLPKGIEKIYCSSHERPASKIRYLEEKLKTSSFSNFINFEVGSYVRDWKEIRPEFTLESQTEWGELGFSYQECKKWADTLGDKFKINDYSFCAWLIDKKELTSENLSCDKIDGLREEYSNYGMHEELDWTNIHPDFTEALQKQWEEKGFNYKDCQLWIKFGCQPQESELADYLWECQRHGFNRLDKNIEIVRTEYPDWKNLDLTLKDIIQWKIREFTVENTKKWLGIGLTPQSSAYCAWLRDNKKLSAEQALKNKGSSQLRRECNDFLAATVANQQWLEQNYPDKEVEEIYINQQLEGELDLSNYNLWKIYISQHIDESKFEIKNTSYRNKVGGKEKTEIIQLAGAQAWLEQNYPQKGKVRDEIIKLDISNKNLEGELDLSGFRNLEELSCWGNKITVLNVGSCIKLKGINCQHNQLVNLECSNLEWLERLICSDNCLTQIIYPTNPEQLTVLNISNNNLSVQDLTIFSQFKNLEELDIGSYYFKDFLLSEENKISQGIYNRFVGSLEPLKGLNKLKEVNISNSDVNSGVEHLPASLETIWYFTDQRPICKLTEIKEQLDKVYWKDIHEDFQPKDKKQWEEQGFTKQKIKEWIEAGVKPDSIEFINWFLSFRKLDLDWAKENKEEFANLRDSYFSFGTCTECKKPNTSEKWCQSCNAKHFQSEFNNWTSGEKKAIDELIQKHQSEATSAWNVLEWIPYEQFSNIKHIANGGFGEVYKARWNEGPIRSWNSKDERWERSKDWQGYKTVVLKTLKNSQNLEKEFLQELTLYKMFKSEVSNMVPCYGISKNKNGNYVMVMKFMEGGSLRDYLKENYQKLKFRGISEVDKIKLIRSIDQGLSDIHHEGKINLLKSIAQGLKDIHRKGLIHRDFHSGNIIVDKKDLRNVYKGEAIDSGNLVLCRITDLGLCRPANENDEEKVYGSLPYVAPEILSKDKDKPAPYTKESDIYSFGIVAYELLANAYPYYDYQDLNDIELRRRVCGEKLRPNIDKLKIPQLLKDLIKRCWDADPKNRPSADNIHSALNSFLLEKDTNFNHQFKELESEYDYFSQNTSYQIHTTAIVTSRLIELFQKDKKEALELEMKKIEQVINQELTGELKKSVGSFIQARKKMLSNEEDEQAMKEVGDLEKELENKGLSQEKIDKIVSYCHKSFKELKKKKKEVKQSGFTKVETMLGEENKFGEASKTRLSKKKTTTPIGNEEIELQSLTRTEQEVEVPPKPPKKSHCCNLL